MISSHDSLTVAVCAILTQRLFNTAFIILMQSPLLHEFHTASFQNGASLRPVIHDCELVLFVSVLDNNSLVDGVVVC